MAARRAQVAPAQGASPRARGNANAAPATPERQPTPEETQAALESAKLNHQTARWNSKTGSFEFIPIAGDPNNSPISSQTMIGNEALGQDIARRQATSNANRATFNPGGQFDSGRQVITNDPAANLRAAAAQGVGRGPANAFPTAGAFSNVQRPVTSNRPAAGAQFFQGMDLSPTTTVVNPSKTEQGAEQAKAALGPSPTIDMGLADRGKGTVDAALDLSRRTVNAALQPVDQTSLEAATADARALLNEMLNGPNTAARIGSQTLRSQLALARSAAGGPGAVAGAFRNAQNAAPELQAQATQAATAETLARQAAAGNITGQLQTSATNQQANETARINAASGAASGFAQGALGARGQDIGIAQSNQSAASNLLNNVSQLTGTQLELDQKNQELIGQMVRDAAAMDYNWGQLDANRQEAEFDRWVKVYGIDQAAAAQIKAAAKASNKNAWDYIIPLAGAAATVIGGALAGPPGAAAGAGAGAVATQAAS